MGVELKGFKEFIMEASKVIHGRGKTLPEITGKPGETFDELGNRLPTDRVFQLRYDHLKQAPSAEELKI